MKTHHIAILTLAVVFASCAHQSKLDSLDVKAIVEGCDIVRTTYTHEPVLPLNQGNGRFGASFSQDGLQYRPETRERDQKYGNTTFLHLEHFTRGKYATDYLLPLLRIYWRDSLTEVTDYRQHQAFYDGTLTTSFRNSGHFVKLQSWFDPVCRDLACMTLESDDKATQYLVIESEPLMAVHYGQQIPQTVNIKREGEVWRVDLLVNEEVCSYFIATDAEGEVVDGKLQLAIRGNQHIQLSYKEKPGISIAKSLSQTKEWWHQQWQQTACIQFPEPTAQKMWVRTMYLLLSTCNDDKRGLPPPCGFAANSWPFAFPQDLSFIHAALLASGHLDIAKAWVEYFAERTDGMKAYTRRLLNREGIMAPWVFPYGDFNGYHDPETPNKFYYEIHNSGYLAKMAFETATFVNDSTWFHKNAEPLIRECAAFYKSIASKESDGLWHLFVEPGMGQDERGGFNQKDYLCALYSAKYCFERMVECNLDETGEYANILAEGLAFAPLRAERGYYYACQGSGPSDFGHQKHPVQLNELAYLPTESAPSNEARTAYELRYDITRDATKPYFYGWTLGEFLLAGSRLGDAEGWKKDWANLLTSEYVDPDFIQVYETSSTYKMSFYSTTNGLMAQTLLSNLVSNWYNQLEIAKCYPWQGCTTFQNIWSALGVKVSGKITNQDVAVKMEAWRDTKFKFMGETILLKKGETVTRHCSL